MKNPLLQYLEERYGNKELIYAKPEEIKKPLVTISREAGCSANAVATILKTRLSEVSSQWRVINREIIQQAANDLEMDPSKIKPIFKGERKTMIDEMLLSMSTRYYKSDWKIKKTISEVIKSIANQGYSVIVGRAGVAITHNYAHSLHIRLHAPLDWRISQISSKHNISLKEAKDYVIEVDKSRNRLLQDFKCDVNTCTLFDMCLNRMTLSDEDVVDVIINMMKVKGIH